MSISSNPILQTVSEYQRLQFLMGEVATCSSLTALSTMNYEVGDRTSAERSLGHAEEAYAMLSLLLDPRHSKHLTKEQVQEVTEELQRLGERLDRLQQLRKWPTELNGKPIVKSRGKQ